MPQRVVLVTGASSGIGLAIAKHLTSKGCIVYGTSRRGTGRENEHGFVVVRLDLDDSDTIRDAVDLVIEREGRIDVLINNAGTGMAGAIEDATTEEINAVFRTNVFAPLEVCRRVIPHMRERRSGKIINISSIAGEFGLPFRGVYSAAKSAVDRFSETLRMELSPWNISVSVIQPGDFRTNINDNRIIAAKSLTDQSPYRKAFERMYRYISKEVASADSPDQVGRVAWKIIRTPKPLMRYPAASYVQRMSLSINRVLPTHLFQKLLAKRYPVE